MSFRVRSAAGITLAASRPSASSTAASDQRSTAFAATSRSSILLPLHVVTVSISPSRIVALISANVHPSIPRLRAERSLTQQALADLVGIPQTHVSAMERGVKLPTLHTVLRLAVAKCKPAALVSAFDPADLAAIVGK